MSVRLIQAFRPVKVNEALKASGRRELSSAELDAIVGWSVDTTSHESIDAFCDVWEIYSG